MIWALVVAGVIIYFVGKKSTSCGVTLGVLFMIGLIVYGAMTAQITYEVQLTPATPTVSP